MTAPAPGLARPARTLWLLAIALAAVAVISLGNGAVAISPGQVLGILARRIGIGLPWAFDDSQRAVLETLRAPRIALGALVGATLAVAGAALQGLFRNPLVDPGLIGVSSGAAFGAALCIVFGAGVLAVAPEPLRLFALPLAAFLGGLLATLLVYRLAASSGSRRATVMLLAGIAVNALVGASIGLLAYVSTDVQLRDLSFWSFGSLGAASWRTLAVVTPLLVLPAIGLFAQSRALDALLLGESEAGHLGHSVARTQLTVVTLGALAVGTAVSVCGIIGFVGLVVPHLARLVLGPAHRALLPASAILGALLVTVADLLGRTMFAPAELPIGIVTAILGAPCFLWLLFGAWRGRTA